MGKDRVGLEPTLEWSSGLTHKHKIRLEMLTRDKHSRLLRKSENYRQKTLGPGPDVIKKFTGVIDEYL